MSFHNQGTKDVLRNKRKHTYWIRDWLHLHQFKPGNITFIFTTNTALRKINREFLQHNHFTDVITFDYTEEKVISGDIFISADQVKKNAVEYAVGFEDELRRVIIHGVLHLMGYDDRTEEERNVMRKMEDDALNLWED
ncbi:MAG TPA: rRNA maturation RNase YbeY [Bacteroides sp.]|nr:rRNA maturation RNase YbeY [Bacteroides sp.]